jgi:hypothetical protein
MLSAKVRDTDGRISSQNSRARLASSIGSIMVVTL